MFFEIVAVPAAVDDEEILWSADGGEHRVPGVAPVVHTLAGAGHEGAWRFRSVRPVGADNDEEWGGGQRVSSSGKA